MKNKLAAFFITLFAVGTVYTALPSTPVGAVCKRVLTFPTWHCNLPRQNGEVAIKELNDFWTIAINIIEILIQFAAYIAAAYVVWGGFKYIKSEGNASKIAESKAVIINSIVALGLAITATAIVEFVASRFR